MGATAASGNVQSTAIAALCAIKAAESIQIGSKMPYFIPEM